MKLNPEQQIAVESSGNLFIRACPGSGKTRVITHKIAYNLEKMTSKNRRIIAVTFTNRAADQIFDRVNQMGIDTSQLWTGTIHSFCLEWIIKPYSSFHPYLIKGFTVIDDAVREKMEKDLKEKYDIPLFEELNFRIGKNGDYVCNINHKRAIEEFYAGLKERKEINYDLMLWFSYEILRRNHEIPKTLSAIFSLICVDEYQDTQELQYAILAEIIKNGAGKTEITYVGDPDQSIYESLGGIAKTKDEIESEQGIPLKELHLSGNYRTNQRIIDFYKNFQSTPGDIVAVGPNKDEIGIITYNTSVDKKDIPKEISRIITLHIKNGVPEKEICVLVPQWWLIRSITSNLKKLLPDVNFDATGMTPLSSQRENVWYKISRLFLTEPSPEMFHYRRRWANEIIEDINTIKGNTEFGEENNPSKILRAVNSVDCKHENIVEYLEECFNKFAERTSVFMTKSDMLVEKKNNYLEYVIKKTNDPDSSFPIETQACKNFYKERNGVLINTCVGVKGEEFEVVIAYGILHGYLPHWNEIIGKKDKGFNASMKKLYVICSRAKNYLHLISEQGRETKTKKPLLPNSELNGIDFDFDEI